MSVSTLLQYVQTVSQWTIPFLIVFIPCYAHCKGVKVYERFVIGAQEGIMAAVRILPYLITMWIGITLLRSAGALTLLARLLQPLFSIFAVPAEVFPLILVRLFSGTGALSVTSELFTVYGPDTPVGLLASILLGSSETTFYVVTVYLGAVGLRKVRHGLTAALIGDLAGLIGALFLWRLFFMR
ncbi:MAG: spore maturation protein [Limnochordia bacterium]